MATVNFISISRIPATPFLPEMFKVKVSAANYNLLISSPNDIALNFYGVPYPLNFCQAIYQYSSLPPYPNDFYFAIEGSEYFIYFKVAALTYYTFMSTDNWLSFDFPYTIPQVNLNVINVQTTPLQNQPVYNPVTFTFSSPKINEIGYRYLVDVYDEADNPLAKLKLVPQPSGLGYVDIQKILSNYVTKDFKPNAEFINDCRNSYLNYKVKFGEEYLSSWNYTNLIKSTGATTNNLTILNTVGLTNTHTYVVGDQITIDTVPTGTTGTINGLHTVVAVPSTTQVIIDVPFPTTGSFIAVSGSTKYSDGRKTAYTNLAIVDDLLVWNGVLDWNHWKRLEECTYLMDVACGKSLCLTSIEPESVNSKPYKRYYMTLNQQYFINVLAPNSDKLYVLFEDNFGNQSVQLINDGISILNKVRQFRVSYRDVINYGLADDLSWVKFQILNTDLNLISEKYVIWFDRRCMINETEVFFMDKLGSILSIPFQLKDAESIEVERDTFNQSIIYTDRQSLDLTNGGDTIHHIKSSKTYTFNTNWMNDRQMELFEIMMESPYTWIYMNGDYHNCIIEDKSTDIEKYKNKSLFRKTVKLKLSQQAPLNI